MNTTPLETPSSHQVISKNPIKSYPDDIRGIFETLPLDPSSVRIRTIFPACLFELIEKLSQGREKAFLLFDALSIAKELETRDCSNPCILPIIVGREIALLGVYDYPGYRFLDWIPKEIDIKLSAYTCLVTEA